MALTANLSFCREHSGQNICSLSVLASSLGPVRILPGGEKMDRGGELELKGRLGAVEASMKGCFSPMSFQVEKSVCCLPHKPLSGQPWSTAGSSGGLSCG